MCLNYGLDTFPALEEYDVCVVALATVAIGCTSIVACRVTVICPCLVGKLVIVAGEVNRIGCLLDETGEFVALGVGILVGSAA